MRRFFGLKSASALVQGSALSVAERSIAQRRMLLPIHIQEAAQQGTSSGSTSSEGSLIDAKLLVKWTSATKKLVHLMPLIAGPQTPQNSSSSTGHVASSVKALQTFRRIALNTYDVASIICVLDNKLPEMVFDRRNLTMHMVKDPDGTLSISGTLYPFVPGREAVEAEKRLYAAVVDRPTTILLKHHLESILTEMFGIEHYYHVIRPNNMRKIAQRQSTRVSAPPRRTLDGVFASSLDPKVELQKHASEPLDKDDAEDETLGDLLNDPPRHDAVLNENVHLDATVSVGESVEPAAAAAAEPQPEEQHLVTDATDEGSQKTDSASKVKSGSKRGEAAKGKKKEQKRKKKKSADVDEQSLFDI